MAPFISIIIPVYNVAPYLRECLDSILAQTFTDWEAICVDDGSTDGSGTILDEYAISDQRFRVTHQANAGVSMARNMALDKVRGEWLTFVDADDLLPKDSLDRLLVTAERVHADIAIGSVKRLYNNGYSTIVGPRFDGLLSPENLYVRYNSLCTWSCGKIYRRKLWKTIRFPIDIAYSEDRYILHLLLYRYPEIPVTAEPAYYYRIHDNSAYGSRWRPEWIQRHKAFMEQIRFFHWNGYKKAELYTVGLYFKYISSDVLQLVKIDGLKQGGLNIVREELRELMSQYWDEFIQSVKHEQWAHVFKPYGGLRTIIEKALSDNGKISLIRQVAFVLKYDGVNGICHRIFLKLKRVGSNV